MTWVWVGAYLVVGLGFARLNWVISTAPLDDVSAKTRTKMTADRVRYRSQGREGPFLAASLTPMLVFTTLLWPLIAVIVTVMLATHPKRAKRALASLWSTFRSGRLRSPF